MRLPHFLSVYLLLNHEMHKYKNKKETNDVMNHHALASFQYL